MGELEQKRIVITYETLYEFLRKEKTKDEIQNLPKTFYSDILIYLEQKKKEIKEYTIPLDLFTTKNQNPNPHITNAIKILKELYDRREKKIIMLALNKAKIGNQIIDTTPLLPEEKAFFETLVKDMITYREGILHCLFKGKHPLLLKNNEIINNDLNIDNKKENISEDIWKKENENLSEQKEKNNESEEKDLNLKKICFIKKVPKFVGKQLEEYGPFNEEEIAELPNEIAELLIRKGRAQEISQ
jgi:DNA replication initiation complex subunit (GINS family)